MSYGACIGVEEHVRLQQRTPRGGSFRQRPSRVQLVVVGAGDVLDAISSGEDERGLQHPEGNHVLCLPVERLGLAEDHREKRSLRRVLQLRHPASVAASLTDCSDGASERRSLVNHVAFASDLGMGVDIPSPGQGIL